MSDGEKVSIVRSEDIDVEAVAGTMKEITAQIAAAVVPRTEREMGDDEKMLEECLDHVRGMTRTDILRASLASQAAGYGALIEQVTRAARLIEIQRDNALAEGENLRDELALVKAESAAYREGLGEALDICPNMGFKHECADRMYSDDCATKEACERLRSLMADDETGARAVAVLEAAKSWFKRDGDPKSRRGLWEAVQHMVGEGARRM